MQTLTGPQKSAIDHPTSRLQIVACAGSGKTEVLARRAVRCLLGGADPSTLIAFTFTEKAAAELKSRIEHRAAEADSSFAELPPSGRGMFVGTTHAWALQVLQGLGGIYETMDGLTAEQEWVLLHRVARRIGVVDLYASLRDRSVDRVATAPAVDAFLRSVEVVHNDRIARDRLSATSPAFAGVLQRYEWLLREMRLMPFRLMIGHGLDELAPGGRLWERLSGRVKHILVDEFQDFNPAQDELLARLSELGATVTVVGDDDQAIYQWRGGDVSLFVSFARRYQGAEKASLAANHRSRPEIVDFARRVVEELRERRLEKTLSAARERAAAGAVEVAISENAEDEASRIGERIARLLDDGHRPRDIAVLYRSVRTSARPLVEDLRRRRIPVSVVGKTSLLARPDMTLVAHTIVWWAGGTWYPNPQFESEVVTPQRLLEEIRALTGCGVHRARELLDSLTALGERVKAEGVSDSVQLFDEMLVILGLPGGGREATARELGLGRMSELLTDFDHAIRRAAPAELYRDLSGASSDEAEEDSELRREEPAAARRRVLGATRGELYLIRLRAFLQEFAGRAAEETPDNSPEADDAVQVMTVHQAKGLEFPVVFVPSLIEGRFPSSLTARPQEWYVSDDLFDRARYEGREDDEARLLYVALTRARELLVVSWFKRHARTQARPSRFLTKHLREALSSAVTLGSGRPELSPAVISDNLLEADFSSLVTYDECGYRYWLRHVCGFQPPLVLELGFGKLLHHMVAELARQSTGGDPAVERDVDPILERSFYLPFAGPVPAKNLKAAARRRVRTYVREYGSELTRTIQPEAPFEVPVANARIHGRIDLLLRAPNGGASDSRRVELIDFKTSANRPPSNVHVNQLRMYGTAVDRLGMEPVALAIHDLDADKGGRLFVSHEPTELRAFEDRVGRWVDGIRSGVFEPVSRTHVCRSCDFRSFCRHATAESRS